MITPDILRALAPRTPKAKRDRFIPYLNEAMPRYGITSELRVAAFLATICIESDYFRTTVEYKASPSSSIWKKYQSKYWPSGYYGRGLIQLTKKPNYDAFWDHVEANGNGSLDAAGGSFVRDPDAIADLFWAVESACWYWQSSGHNERADKGQFFAIQGLVNRGDARKQALHYADRLRMYDAALRALPDDLVPPVPSDPVPLAPVAESKPILDRVFAPFETAKAKFDQLGVDPATISKSSAVMTIFTKVMGWLGLLFGFVTDNWLYILISIAVIGFGVYIFHGAKANATARAVALKG